MVSFFLPVILMLTALGVIAFVFIRHFPQAAAVDLESLPAEQEAAMKAALLERRLQRKLADFKKGVLPVFRRFWTKGKKLFSSFSDRLQILEQRYRRKPVNMTVQQKKEMGEKIGEMIATGKSLLSAGKWEEAEQVFIEVISWDSKHVEAYCFLGEVYFLQKQFAQAKETFVFLFKLLEAEKRGEKTSLVPCKLSEADIAEASYDFVCALQALGETEKAKKIMGELLQKDGKNPKYLDKIIELSILLRDRKEARHFLAKLKEANPQNQKVSLFEEQISHL